MAQPRVLVLRAPGTNCDRETAYAFEQAGAVPVSLHVAALLDQPDQVDDCQIFCLPGGFSYGDDVAAGRVLANQLRLRLADTLHRFRDQGKLVLGICNGFQVLIKSGLLFDIDDPAQQPATLTWNDSGRFEDRWVHLTATPSDCVFLRGVERLYLPIAHAEGKFVARDFDTLGHLDSAGQLVLRYSDEHGNSDGGLAYPANPNGSMAAVAGVADASGRVFGLMPHPERFIDPTQHPRWTREPRETGDGLQLFHNAVAHFA